MFIFRFNPLHAPRHTPAAKIDQSISRTVEQRHKREDTGKEEKIEKEIEAGFYRKIRAHGFIQCALLSFMGHFLSVFGVSAFCGFDILPCQPLRSHCSQQVALCHYRSVHRSSDTE